MDDCSNGPESLSLKFITDDHVCSSSESQSPLCQHSASSNVDKDVSGSSESRIPNSKHSNGDQGARQKGSSSSHSQRGDSSNGDKGGYYVDEYDIHYDESSFNFSPTNFVVY